MAHATPGQPNLPRTPPLPPYVQQEAAYSSPSLFQRFGSGVRRYVHGDLPAHWLSHVIASLACATFLGGVALSAVYYAQSGTGQWVISHLASPFFNPDGYRFLAISLMLVAGLLIPYPRWFHRSSTLGLRRRQVGVAAFYVGIVGTFFIGLERLCWPELGTFVYAAHYCYAACGFIGLWLAVALFDGHAIAGPGNRAVARRGVLPWSAVPPLVVVGIVGGLSLIPGMRERVRAEWPRDLIFLRTVAFWQWYIIAGMMLTFRGALRNARLGLAQAGQAQPPSPQQSIAA